MGSCAGARDPNLNIFHASILCSDVRDSLWIVLRLNEFQNEWVLTTCLFEVFCRQNRVIVLNCWNAMTRRNALCFFCRSLGRCFRGFIHCLCLIHWFMFHWFLLNWFLWGWIRGWGLDILLFWCRMGGLFNWLLFFGGLLRFLSLVYWLLLSYSFLFFNFGCLDLCLNHWSFSFDNWDVFYFFSCLNLRFLFLNILGALFFRLFNVLLFRFLFTIWLIVVWLVFRSVVVSWAVILFSLVVIEVGSSFWKNIFVFHVLLGSAQNLI